MRKEIELALAEKIGSNATSSTGSRLFFSENTLAEKYRNLFSIECDSFVEAFRIVTGGVGNEIAKINSLTSSSLLSLLVFYPLFNNSAGESMNISVNHLNDGQPIAFDKCFFEVRNKVVRRPSCMDVVLQSADKKTLLFLESKFLEYEETTDHKTYGKGYHELYAKYLQGLLNGIKVDEKDSSKTKLYSDAAMYIEGIKQTISHLIGMIRGPKSETSDCYTKEYLEAYSEAYNNARTLVYGTILFNPVKFSGNSLPYTNYVRSYTEIIGRQGDKIVGAIRKWICDKNCNDRKKKIVVLEAPLTYQGDISEDYKSHLTTKIREFYRI